MGSDGRLPRAGFAAVEQLAGNTRPQRLRKPGVQESHGLILGTMPHPEKGPLGQVLGSGHGRPVSGAIALGRARVCVEAEERVGREAGRRHRDMEAAGEVCRQLRVGLGVGGQRGQRRLRMGSSAVPAERREVERHDGRRRGELAVVKLKACYDFQRPGPSSLLDSSCGVVCLVLPGVVVCGWLRDCAGESALERCWRQMSLATAAPAGRRAQSRSRRLMKN